MTETESVAKVLLVNELNQALILTVGEYKAHPEKSFKPDLPGGLVDAGETEKDAAIREVLEETGIAITPGDTTLAYTETKFYPAESKSVPKLLYVSFLKTTPAVTLSWEHSAYEWTPLDQLKQGIELRPFYKEAIAYCFEHQLL